MFSYTKIMQGIQAVSAVVTDAYFNLVTLLLNTTTTNGAQNNTFLDSGTANGGVGFTITRNGNPTQGTFTPFSQTGWSNFFNGSTDYLTSTSNTAVTFGTSAYTVEMWVYQNARNASGAYLLGGAGTQMIQVNITSTGTVNANLSGGASYATTTATVPLNTWTHLAFVRTSTSANGFQIYINGVSSATGTDATNYASTNTLNIGTTNSSTTFVLNGYLSNLRVTKSGALYTSTFTPSTIPLTTTVSAGTVSLLTTQSNRFVDNSAAPFTLTTVGTPSVQAFSPFAPTAAYSTTTVGGSGYFDGTGDFLSVTANAAFNFGAPSGNTNDFTIEMWVYPTRSAFVNFENLYGTGGSGVQDQLNLSSAGVAGYFDGTTTVNSPALVLNQWNHVAVVRNGAGSNNLRVYANGVSGTSATSTNSLGSSVLTPRIGLRSDGLYPYQGYISNVRVVKGTAVYTAAFTPPTAPLTNIANTSLLLNYTNAGIFDAAAKNVLETVGNAQVSTTQAKFGTTSMYFDGTGDYLSVPASPNFNFGSGDFTIECWLYPTSHPGSVYLVSQANGADYAPVACFLVAGKPGIGATSASGSWAVNATSTTTLALNTWTHVAYVRFGNKWSVYITGVETVIAASTSVTVYNSTDPLGIGGEATTSLTYPYFGYIDELRITRGVARYTTTFTPATAAFPTQ